MCILYQMRCRVIFICLQYIFFKYQKNDGLLSNFNLTTRDSSYSGETKEFKILPSTSVIWMTTKYRRLLRSPPAVGLAAKDEVQFSAGNDILVVEVTKIVRFAVEGGRLDVACVRGFATR